MRTTDGVKAFLALDTVTVTYEVCNTIHEPQGVMGEVWTLWYFLFAQDH